MIFLNVRKELPIAQRLRGQNHFNASPNKYRNKSNNPRNIDRESVTVWKFFCTDVEGIKRICSVGAVLHNIGCTRHSLSKLNFALVGTIFRGGLLPIRQVFRRLCLFGNRCGRGSRRLPSDSGEILSFCDSARKSLIS